MRLQAVEGGAGRCNPTSDRVGPHLGGGGVLLAIGVWRLVDAAVSATLGGVAGRAARCAVDGGGPGALVVRAAAGTRRQRRTGRRRRLGLVPCAADSGGSDAVRVGLVRCAVDSGGRDASAVTAARCPQCYRRLPGRCATVQP